MARKWNMINDQSNENYALGNEIIYSTEVLRLNLCDHSNAYIRVRDYITIEGNAAAQVAFTNCAPFTKCIKKIHATKQMMLKTNIWLCQCITS